MTLQKFDVVSINIYAYSYAYYIFLCQILELNAITTHHWSVVGVSAVTGDQLLASVDWLLDDIAKRIFTLD